jgi:hypothetical protein
MISFRSIEGKMPTHKTCRLLFLVLILLFVVATAAAPAAGAYQSGSIEFELYPADSNMGLALS